MMSSSTAVILMMLIVYLIVGNVLWIIGIENFGGMEAYREYLKSIGSKYVPLWVIYLIYLVVWPFFIRRRK